MLYFIVATFIGALSDVLCKFFVVNKYINASVMDAFLHVNLINVVLYFIVYFYLKREKKITFKITDSFNTKKELIQVGLYSIALLSAVYKTFVLGHVQISCFAIIDMLKPMVVWVLSTIILKEKFHKEYIKYILIALCGYTISNYKGFNIDHLWFLVSFLLFSSLGAVTTRSYARRKKESMQAIGTECILFAVQSLIWLPIKGTFDYHLLINKYIWAIALLAFVRHFLVIIGIRLASSTLSIELFALSKIIFLLVLAAFMLNDIPSLYKIVGSCIMFLSLLGFWNLEKKYKNQQRESNDELKK